MPQGLVSYSIQQVVGRCDMVDGVGSFGDLSCTINDGYITAKYKYLHGRLGFLTPATLNKADSTLHKRSIKPTQGDIS